MTVAAFNDASSDQFVQLVPRAAPGLQSRAQTTGVHRAAQTTDRRPGLVTVITVTDL